MQYICPIGIGFTMKCFSFLSVFVFWGLNTLVFYFKVALLWNNNCPSSRLLDLIFFASEWHGIRSGSQYKAHVPERPVYDFNNHRHGWQRRETVDSPSTP